MWFFFYFENLLQLIAMVEQWKHNSKLEFPRNCFQSNSNKKKNKILWTRCVKCSHFTILSQFRLKHLVCVCVCVFVCMRYIYYNIRLFLAGVGDSVVHIWIKWETRVNKMPAICRRYRYKWKYKAQRNAFH